jgi:hypothetical protein
MVESIIQFFDGFKNLFDNHYSVRFNNLKKSTENLRKAINVSDKSNFLTLDQVQNWFKEFLFLKEFQNHLYSGEISHIYFKNLANKVIGSNVVVINPDYTGSFNSKSNCNSGADCQLSCLSYSYFFTVGSALIEEFMEKKKYKKKMTIISVQLEALNIQISDCFKPLNDLLKTVEENLFAAANISHTFNPLKCAVYPNEKLQLPASLFPNQCLLLTRSNHGGDLINNLKLFDVVKTSNIPASRTTRGGSKLNPKVETPARKKMKLIIEKEENNSSSSVAPFNHNSNVSDIAEAGTHSRDGHGGDPKGEGRAEEKQNNNPSLPTSSSACSAVASFNFNSNETSFNDQEKFPACSAVSSFNNSNVSDIAEAGTHSRVGHGGDPEGCEEKQNNNPSSPTSSSTCSAVASFINNSNVISFILPTTQEHASDDCGINSDLFLQSLEDQFDEQHQQSYSIDNLMLDVVKSLKQFDQNISTINFLFTIFILKSFTEDGCIDFSNVSLIDWFRTKFNVFKTLLKANLIYSLNTEQYTKDEIAWFSFYNSNYCYKPQNAKYLKPDQMDLVLGKTNDKQKSQLLNNYKTSHDEIESLVKKFKLKDALNMSHNDQVKYEMTEAEISKYLKLSEIFNSAENMIAKRSTANLLENAFNEAVKYIVQINMALNMKQIQTKLLFEEYTDLNHVQVVKLVEKVHKFGETAVKTIKSLDCFKLRNEVLNSTKESKKFVDSEIKKKVLNMVLPKRTEEEKKRLRKPTSHFLPSFNRSNNKVKKNILKLRSISFDEDADDLIITEEEEERKKTEVVQNNNKKEMVADDLITEEEEERKKTEVVQNNNKKEMVVEAGGGLLALKEKINKIETDCSSSTSSSCLLFSNQSSSGEEQIGSEVLLLQEISQYFNPNKMEQYEYITNVQFCVLMSKAQHLNKSDRYIDLMEEGNTQYVDTVTYHVKDINVTTTEEYQFTKDEINTFRIDNDLSINGTNDMIWQAFSNLYSKEWLSDNIISIYCNMLNARELSLWKLYPNRKKNYFIDMWLIDLLRRDGTCTWFRKLNIFKFDFLFICINILNTHWTLVRVSIKNRAIEYVDSLLTSCSVEMKNKDLDTIEKWLIYEQKHHDNDRSCTLGTARWSKTIQQNNLQQSNGYDCGVFMLISAYFLSEFESFESYNAHIMNQGRRKIAFDLYNGYIEDPRINDVNEHYFVYRSTKFKELNEERKNQLMSSLGDMLRTPDYFIRLFFKKLTPPTIIPYNSTTNVINIIDNDSDEEDKEKYVTKLVSNISSLPKQNLYVSTFQEKKIRVLESENKLLKEQMDELLLKLQNMSSK